MQNRGKHSLLIPLPGGYKNTLSYLLCSVQRGLESRRTRCHLLHGSGAVASGSQVSIGFSLWNEKTTSVLQRPAFMLPFFIQGGVASP